MAKQIIHYFIVSGPTERIKSLEKFAIKKELGRVEDKKVSNGNMRTYYHYPQEEEKRTFLMNKIDKSNIQILEEGMGVLEENNGQWILKAYSSDYC